LPLPANKNDRVRLLTHELFHRAQPALGFKLYNVSNDHLDQKDGRVYLRLELEALKAALLASSRTDMKTHLRDAFIFRNCRRSLYAGSDTTENLLELNEGIAEYTGLIMSGMNKKEVQKDIVKGIAGFLTNPTFVRSFAYQTTPIYGYLLYDMNKEWNRDISVRTNLTEYFMKAFDIALPDYLNDAATTTMDRYNGQSIVAEENAREEKTKERIAEYKRRFLEQPHLELRFINMNISFDPRNIMPLEDKGTVYPTIRVTDNWGILTVENGALLSANFDKITVCVPTAISDAKVVGDGWTLELRNGYTVQKGTASNDYILKKN